MTHIYAEALLEREVRRQIEDGEKGSEGLQLPGRKVAWPLNWEAGSCARPTSGAHLLSFSLSSTSVELWD